MDWPVVEVVIGLAFFFFLMSVIVSAINEAVASAFSLRARGMEKALVRMLGVEQTQALLDTPLIATQRKSDKPIDVDPGDRRTKVANAVPFRPRGPSYLAASTFSAALHQIVGHEGPGYSLDLDAVTSPDLRDVLTKLAEEVSDDANKLRAAVEDWFDRTMERASGWYKRRVQAMLLVIGLSIAAVANLSAVTVGDRLWNDSSLRAVVAAETQRTVDTTTTTTGKGPLEQARDDFKSIQDLGFPAGWGHDNRPQGWGWLASILGWVVTAFAVTLGAPFWFDLLGKVSNFRAAGKKPDPAPTTTAPAVAGVVTPVPQVPAAKALRGVLGKNERVVVIASATALSGRADLGWLYRLLDTAGQTIAELELEEHYGTVRVLSGPDVTRQGLVTALRDAGSTANCRAVDLVLMVHGAPDKLILAAPGGTGTAEVNAVDLAGDLSREAELNGRLRLCYSTACYGASHAPALIGAGFNVVIGAKKINSNSATELPVLLQRWGRGDEIGEALKHADDPGRRAATDFLAHALEHFDDVDSEKVLFGNAAATIDASP